MGPFAAIALLLAAAAPAEAYIGPGAGFVLLSSFFVLFTTIVIAIVSLLVWPFRALVRLLAGKRPPRPLIRRLVVIGFDGQDPRLTDRFLEEGLLPNFARLAAAGCYRRLATTFPSVSPVAWSSFSTGCHPARHNIFDFIDRDRRTYLPVLSSARVGRVERFFSLGPFRVPREKPDLRLLRKSKPFWAILGEHRVWSTILRVPVTFPPDRFYGAELSAMCVPDLLGTQGTFLLYTTKHEGPVAAGRAKPETRNADGRHEAQGPGHGERAGIRIPVTLQGDEIRTAIPGPPNIFRRGAPQLEVPLTFRIDRGRREVEACASGTRLTLRPRELSPWVRLVFPAAPGIKVSGLTRMMVTELDEHVSVYLSPLNIDPERPAMPIAHPGFYAAYLAKRIGPFATLGLAEDTGALNEGVIDEATFLAQTYDIDTERQAMLFAALDRLRTGTLVCVFDATDRVQHMFWRYLDDDHPARPKASGPETPDRSGSDPVRDLYRRNDALVGRLLGRLDRDDVLMVISDHGFSSFRRGVNLNAWLHREGYLALKEDADGRAEWLRDVDWSRTKAYCLGLTGIFLNVKGREAHGIVAPGGEAARLKQELIGRLSGLRDEERGEIAIRDVFDPSALYAGPYLPNAPDLLVGYNAGYRVSWECATGVVAGPVFMDNRRPWSGDHCIDPRLVPGVFFCNRKVDAKEPRLIDLAPTALKLFGITPPPYMDGKAML